MPGPLAAATYCATLVDEWARLGLTDAVVCPGSRSTPMALALAEDDRVRVHVHLDERAGAFTALGLAKATGRAVAVLTTSGTAAVELHPAAVEAAYGGVPLVLLTADRPPELQGVGASQTIDQRALFGGDVRLALDPGPPDSSDPSRWRGWAGQLLTAAHATPPGPVHLNLAFREPLLGPVGTLPEPSPPDLVVEPIDHPTPPEVEALAELVSGRSGLVVAGAGAGAAADVHELADRLGWPVVADPLSGCRGLEEGTIAHVDALLRHAPFADAQTPEVVIRLGRPHASKVLAQWLGGLGVEQVHIDPSGLPADPERVVTRAVVADGSRALRRLRAADPAPAPAAWRKGWVEADRAARSAIEQVLADHPEPTEPGVARAVLAALPDRSTLVVSSSMPVRDLEWYGAPGHRGRVLANRGANGIDGVVSTAAGVALSGAPSVALVGDLAFLHDTNGLLGAGDRGIALTVVVVDNDGGGIFSFLAPRAELPEDRYEQLFGTPHGLDVAAVARAHGATAEVVESAGALPESVRRAIAGRGVRVIVVRTDRAANVVVHDEINARVAEVLAR